MKESKQTIVTALNLAIQKGCYSLDDVAAIVDALRVVFPAEDEEEKE